MKFIKKNKRNIAGAGAFGLVLVLILWAGVSGQGGERDYISYNQFMELSQKGDVSTVTLNDGDSIGFTTLDGKKWLTDNPQSPTLREELLKMGISLNRDPYSGLYASFQPILSLLFLAGGFFFMTRYMNKSRGGMALKTGAVEAGTVKTDFSHVAGNEEARESVADIVDFIKNPAKYEAYGARMPKGVIFYGPPGTGKTLMAKAVAGEAGVPFFAVTGADFVQMYVGVGAARVRDLFKKAREAGKAVIFIDEIDALGKKRIGGGTGAHDERDQTLNALLTEMSGFSSGEGIVVIGATNRLDTLDEALLRPGRFDRQVEISLPDFNGRKKILGLHSSQKPLGADVDLDAVAKMTVYFSGADLENLMNEAAIAAAKAGVKTIGRRELDGAYYTVLAGAEKKDRSLITRRDKEITAYHEAGHSISGKLHGGTVSKITIIPSARGAGGFCVNIPADRMYYTKKELEGNVITALSGRAAEEIIFGRDNVTTGAANDIEKAAGLVKDYITRFGMSGRAGLMPMPEEKLYEESRALMDEFYAQAKKILEKNLSLLHETAEELLQKESLNEEEFGRIYNRHLG